MLQYIKKTIINKQNGMLCFAATYTVYFYYYKK